MTHPENARQVLPWELVPPRHNRVRAILSHGWRYAFHPTERLAADVGVAPRTIRRLLRGGRTRPHLLQAVADALTRDLRLPVPLPVREVFSPDGSYPTPSTCALCDCDGCLPDDAYDGCGRLRPEWRDAAPGDWCHYSKAVESANPEPEDTEGAR